MQSSVKEIDNKAFQKTLKKVRLKDFDKDPAKYFLEEWNVDIKNNKARVITFGGKATP